MSEEQKDIADGESIAADPALTAEPAHDSRSEVWQSLRQAREARGLTIAEVAHHLKFTPKQVEAMEMGALKQLPGPAFTRGFVRNYARFLQLDVRPFMAALEPAHEDLSLQPPPPRLGNMPSSKTLERFPALPA
ncbi:MAG TPA: helix-turn-helix transcriptional regulator, partial [Rhodocyclaceae bacterium]|nr:helix-turn-helix transcriptional regulator [Rhodocyclaceae bacterium]